MPVEHQEESVDPVQDSRIYYMLAVILALIICIVYLLLKRLPRVLKL